MNFSRTKIPDLVVIEPTIHKDDRGFFYESYRHDLLENFLGYKIKFIQENHSKSSKHVLRGLHFQAEPYSQSKLIKVLCGEIFDVAVDIRPDSKSYGEYVSIVLSSNNCKQFFIPQGFAHGFLVLSDSAEILYKVDTEYNKDSEKTLIYDDHDINIAWPEINHGIFTLSDKDFNGLSLKDLINKK